MFFANLVIGQIGINLVLFSGLPDKVFLSSAEDASRGSRLAPPPPEGLANPECGDETPSGAAAAAAVPEAAGEEEEATLAAAA